MSEEWRRISQLLPLEMDVFVEVMELTFTKSSERLSDEVIFETATVLHHLVNVGIKMLFSSTVFGNPGSLGHFVESAFAENVMFALRNEVFDRRLESNSMFAHSHTDSANPQLPTCCVSSICHLVCHKSVYFDLISAFEEQ
jgi:hypothetical protein